jgi:hypothetical protein
MRRDQLVGSWKLTAWGPLPIDYTSVMTLFDDGSASVATSKDEYSSMDQATWEYIDDAHWNLNLQVAPDPKTPGLEDGAIDVSEYEIVESDANRMELMVFDFEFPFVYERVSNAT